MRKTIALMFVASLAGCDLNATAEADSVCVQEDFTGRTVPGAGLLPPGVTASVTIPVPFQVNIGSAIPDVEKKGVTADAIAQSVALRAVGSGVDFSGVTQMTFKLVATGQPDVVFTYERPAGATGVTELVATPSTPVDFIDYLQGTDTITLSDVTLSGRPPETAWTPAIRTCAATKVKVDYIQAAKN